jgi:tetratricopeptide (TPR) repeat protein
VSQSPLEPAPADDPDAGAAYRRSWSALNKLLRRGYSWSGREQNCAFLNLEGRGFANVSAAAGFDFPDDARATVLVDWDGDGDQDVFTSNRSGPRLRFLRNDQDTGNASVTFELRGTRSNRDAIGARVELGLTDARGNTRTLVRGVRAGEGYLAQSSSRLTFGLGAPGAKFTRVRVFWPGGEGEDFSGAEPGRAWRLVQGSARAQELELARAAPLSPSRPVAPPVTRAARVPLVRPVPLPRLEVQAEDGTSLALFGLKAGGEGTGTGRPVLIELFSSDCAPCVRALDEHARHAAEFERAGLAPLALSVEPFEHRARAGAFLQARGWPFPWAVARPEALELLDALAGILVDSERRLPLPTSFLVDAQGALRVLYFGPVDADQVLADRALCELGDGAQFDAAAPFPGRWMFPGLVSDADLFEPRLAARGLAAAGREFARGRLTVVRSTPADLLHQFGRQHAVAGRLDEAQKFFQRALAADPRHFATLSDWAVVLHRQEKLASAAELYGKALALDPEHADTRFNLALALLGLENREGAENQLRWLEARDAESAAVLRQVLSELSAPK